MWRGWQTSACWESTLEESLSWSVKTAELLKRPSRDCNYLQHSERITSHKDCLCPFIVPPLRAYGYTACAYGTPAAQRLRGKRSRGVINTAQKIVGCPLPSLEELHSSHCLKKAQNIIKDTHHPGHTSCSNCCLQADGTGACFRKQV